MTTRKWYLLAILTNILVFSIRLYPYNNTYYFILTTNIVALLYILLRAEGK